VEEEPLSKRLATWATFSPYQVSLLSDEQAMEWLMEIPWNENTQEQTRKVMSNVIAGFRRERIQRLLPQIANFLEYGTWRWVRSDHSEAHWQLNRMSQTSCKLLQAEMEIAAAAREIDVSPAAIEAPLSTPPTAAGAAVQLGPEKVARVEITLYEDGWPGMPPVEKTTDTYLVRLTDLPHGKTLDDFDRMRTEKEYWDCWKGIAVESHPAVYMPFDATHYPAAFHVVGEIRVRECK